MIIVSSSEFPHCFLCARLNLFAIFFASAGLPRYKKKSVVNGDSGSEKRPLKAIYMSADELIASVSPATPAAAIKLHGPFIQNR